MPPVAAPVVVPPVSTPAPVEVPIPVVAESKPEPADPVPPAQAEIKPIEPPVTTTPVTVPTTTVPPHPSNNIPDSSVTPQTRELEDQKPVVKAEPRNGLDKVDPSHYIDPIERSLASLERSLNADVPMDVSVGVSESSMRLDDFSLPKTQMMPDAAHQNLMAQLGGLTEIAHVPEQIKNEMYVPPHNGFVEKNMQHDREMLRADVNPSIPDIAPVAPVSSIFDPIPIPPHSVISQSQSHHNMPGAACLMTPAVKKEEIKPLLTPKPIEDLIGVSNMVSNKMYDRAKYEMEKKIEDPKNSNFVQAFKMKQEQNLKNASSWSSLAQAGSPQSIPNISTNNQMKQKPVMDSFQVSTIFKCCIVMWLLFRVP